MDALVTVNLADAYAEVSLTDRTTPEVLDVARIAVKEWWLASGGAGITLQVTRVRLTVPPLLDLTTVTQAQLRTEDVRGQVKTLVCSVLSGATPQTASIRRPLQAGDFSLGEYRVTGLVSAEGVTWYPTDEVGLVVEH
jgi:hypothetical protein